MRRFIAAVIVLTAFVWLLGAEPTKRVWGNPLDPRQRAEQSAREVRELEAALKAMEESIAVRQARVRAVDSELLLVREKLARARRSENQADAKLKVLTVDLGKRVRMAYMRGGASFISLVLRAESFGDLFIRLTYITRLFRHDAALIDAVSAEQAVLRESQRVLQAEQLRLESLEQRRTAEQRNLESERRELARLLERARAKLAGDLALVSPRAERLPVYAVVIDNLAQARPQWGLALANLIYEYEVEGRITRYLALFGVLPKRVGPVRSARAHSAMLALESRAHFVYSGGGVDVLDLLRQWGVSGTDAIRSRSASFTRDAARRAPHNLFVNLATLGSVAPPSDVHIRPAYLPFTGEAAPRLELAYSGQHKVSYVYVPEQAAFRRYINGVVHRDAGGATIMARNVIVQFAPHSTDLLGRPTPQVVGNGVMHYYALGQRFLGTWRKDSPESPTRFYYADGTEVERIFGQTWVQIMRLE
ncbi:MAG: putative lipoprotein YerB [Firmicutes bacterium]|nr:putative lipoprotein YerB [candidate division NPL-UPA2 bacterium]